MAQADYELGRADEKIAQRQKIEQLAATKRINTKALQQCADELNDEACQAFLGGHGVLSDRLVLASRGLRAAAEELDRLYLVLGVLK